MADLMNNPDGLNPIEEDRFDKLFSMMEEQLKAFDTLPSFAKTTVELTKETHEILKNFAKITEKRENEREERAKKREAERAAKDETQNKAIKTALKERDFRESEYYQDRFRRQEKELGDQKARDIRGQAGKQFLPAFGATLVENSPILSLVTALAGKRSPGDFKQSLLEEQGGIKGEYTDKRKAAFDDAYESFTNRGKDEPLHFGDPTSKAAPTQGDLSQLPAIYGEPALYLGQRIEELAGVIRDDEYEDPGDQEGLLTGGGGGAIGNLLGAIPKAALVKLASVAVPVIVTAMLAYGLFKGVKWLQDFSGDKLVEEVTTELDTHGEIKDRMIQNRINEAPKETRERIQKLLEERGISADDPMAPQNFYKVDENNELVYKPQAGDINSPWKKVNPTPEQRKELWTRATEKHVQLGVWGDENDLESQLLGINSGLQFHNGGQVPGAPGTEVPATLIAGEYVLNPEQVDKYLAKGNDLMEQSDMHQMYSTERLATLLEQLNSLISSNLISTLQDGTKEMSSNIQVVAEELRTSKQPYPAATRGSVESY